MSEPCFCGREWPHPNDEPEPPVCSVCGREWRRDPGSEGSAVTLRCEHGPDETCWHPGQVCEYWYSPFAHTVCSYGRRRKARPALFMKGRCGCDSHFGDLPSKWRGPGAA